MARLIGPSSLCSEHSLVLESGSLRAVNFLQGIISVPAILLETGHLSLSEVRRYTGSPFLQGSWRRLLQVTSSGELSDSYSLARVEVVSSGGLTLPNAATL